MPQGTEHRTAAFGFRVKSGWAMAVVLAGPAESPSLLLHQEVLLSDPAVPHSKQPYHPSLELPQAEGRKLVSKLTKVVERMAHASVKDLLEKASRAGLSVRAAGMVVGSVVDPASLHNDHIRAHALEGQLFRTALESALREKGLTCRLLVEKSAYGVAAEALGCSEKQAKQSATKLGESVKGPWRAEEKLAALAARVALANRE